MSSNHLVVLATARAQVGQEDELKSRLEGVAKASWEEPGVVKYAVHDLAVKPGEFIMGEVYASREAFDAHLETKHVKRLIADLGDLVDRELVVHQGTTASFSAGPKGAL